MEKKFYVVDAYVEYSNNDMLAIVSVTTDKPLYALVCIGSYLISRSFKTNGWGRNKKGCVNLSFRDNGKYGGLYQMYVREDGKVEYVRARGGNLVYDMDSELFKERVAAGELLLSA